MALSTAIMRAAPKSSVAGDSKSTSSVAAMSGHKELLGDDYSRCLLHCLAGRLSGLLLNCSSGSCCA